MDGREAMALSSGTSPYYIHRGTSFVPSGPQQQQQQQQQQQHQHHAIIHTPPGFRQLSNPSLQTQSTGGRLGSTGQAFSIEQCSSNFSRGTNVATPSGVSVSEPVKKKRGRPRKYVPDGQVSLGLSPMMATPKPFSGDDPLSPRKRRGRPPGSGRKQQLASLGDWMNSSAGIAFAPHVISIGVGEDIVAKLLSFSQQRPRAVCILSGSGTVSSVTLCQPANTGPSVTYEGRFEILCLSGSYLVAEDGGPRNRTGGVSASLSSPEGHVIGGAIGMLIAASPVQVVVCSFVHGSSKNKDKQVGRPKLERDSSSQPSEKPTMPKPITPEMIPQQNFSPSPVSIWAGTRPVDMRNPHTDIDLTQG